MTTIRSICVYCGSSSGSNPLFVRAAQDLGYIMAKNDIRLVYGGGNCGLMGEIARSVQAHGGYVCGIIPDFLRSGERAFKGAQELIIVPDMHSRKRMMFEKADAFVAMPGGIGTLEELVEVMTWAQLGRHNKPILMLNIDEFWRPLLSLFSHMRDQGFIRTDRWAEYLISDQVDDVLPMLQTGAQSNNNKETEAWIKERF